ncbi:DNA (cytosine-5-)-methyltransferase [Paratractidigestivibacter sp.]|uniref:DNA (cytosine-5-)-methyltransferase n=1 Tax=Paratractidigestivibacter sp. TaxID=2847316 RepID=UPI002ABE8D5F|nr:DNA (cytosine-5-)-methyltransferase [Paratractidigestivibacter sp.]
MSEIKVAELFAGVGGFRLGLEGYHDSARPNMNLPSAGPYRTIWANQWEPPGTESKQFAASCYRTRFGEGSVVNEDIHEVIEQFKRGECEIPDVDMVVGGFPCQDYSVAKPLSQAGGIEGKKGVLWWDIYNFLRMKGPKKQPRYVLLENVDRLLKSPATQRGRDFAIILSCLNELGYSVEWRVINSGEYGFPQRRKRTYILARLTGEDWNLSERLTSGVMAEAFPIEQPEEINYVDIPEDPYEATQSFNKGARAKVSPFMEAGIMQDGRCATAKVTEAYSGERLTLGDVLVNESEVPEKFFIEPDKLPQWEYLKGAKREKRVNKQTGYEYTYSEGAMAFPDATNRPSRTILTGEGGRGASRFKHVIKCEDGRYRRLVPDELDQLQGFPRGWTNTGMSDGRRAFCMGNALVVGIPHRIGQALIRSIEAEGA